MLKNNKKHRVSTIDFAKSVDINPNIRLTVFKNGHLIGAAILLIQIRYKGYPNINLLFTGDYNPKNIFFNVPKLRKAVKELPLTIIQESTYGTTNSNEVIECFEENVLECIKGGGTVVNMAFSLGRFQEILYKLKSMQDEGKLSTDIPIFADGTLGLRYTALFSKEELEIKSDLSYLKGRFLNLIINSNCSHIVYVTVINISPSTYIST